jgi:hypothetical protein
MPLEVNRILQKSMDTESRTQAALYVLRKGEISSIRRTAAIYNISYERLRRRHLGIQSRSTFNASKRKLTPAEEETLIQWILSMDKRGFPLRPATVTEKANLLISNRGSEPIEQHVGERWIYGFLNRHPEVKTRFSRRYDYQRAKCEDPKVIQPWFETLIQTVLEYGILDDDIYNFDETGFAMGLIATAKVIVSAETRGRPHLIQPGQREWVTSIEAINAVGKVLPPYVIFKGKTKRLGWFEDAIPGMRIETSPNGWTTDDIGFDWLKNHFVPITAPWTVGVYRLLILDGHGSHVTPKFDKICADNKIITLCLPAHSSHLLQPLDVACFGPLKRFYGRFVEERSRLGFYHIDKLDFLAAFPKARSQAFKVETIKNSFAASGVVPYNPERVLEKLNVRLSTRTPPPPSSQSSWGLQTPHNTAQLQHQASSIKTFLEQMPPSPSDLTNRAINQVVKGCELALNNVVLLARENQDLRAAIELESRKRKRSSKTITLQGSMTAEEALQLFEAQDQPPIGESGPPAESAAESSQPPKRAPPRCSNHIVGHNRLRCPNPISN